MKMKPDIDELLNGFIDGELSSRQQTEVQRLIANDTQIRQRLKQLKKTKLLVGSLPFVEAPSDTYERVTTSLERRTLLDEQSSSIDQYTGARHLFVRKLVAAAAMVGLVAVLAVLVHSIIAPETPPPTFVAEETNIIKPAPAVAFAEFNGRLELKTNVFIEIDSAINKAIKANPLMDCTSLDRLPDKSRYVLTCSHRGLDMFLSRLGTIWPRFDSATLFVKTKDFDQRIVIDRVTAQQIARIASQQTAESSFRVARDFAMLNNMADRLPGKEVFAALDTTKKYFITIPKPPLTSDEGAVEKPTTDEDLGKVSLVIVVTAGK